MATFTYGHFDLGVTVGTWYVDVWETDVNDKDNSSVVNVHFYVKVTHNNQRSEVYSTSTVSTSYIYIDGIQCKYQRPATFDLRYNSVKKVPNGTVYDLGTVSKKYYHNDNGERTLSIRCTHLTGISDVNDITIKGDFKLSKIIQYKMSTIDAANGIHSIGSSPKITITASHSNLKHTVWFKCGNTNLKQTYSNLAPGTHNINIPSSWKSEILASKAAATLITIYCETYLGSEYLGTTSTPMSIKNYDTGGKLSVPSGVFNIGEKLNFTMTTDADYMLYDIQYKTGKHPTWISLVKQKSYSQGSHTVTINEIPIGLANGLYNQETDLMTIRISSYQKGELISQESKQVTIKNNEYALTATLDVSGGTYVENGQFIAGKTSLDIKYLIGSTFDAKSLTLTMTGANTGSKTITWPSRSGIWYTDVLPNAGVTTVTMTVVDVVGHTATKTFSVTFYAKESLAINSLEEKNGKVYVKKANNLGKTKFKVYCTWKGSSKNYRLDFKVTGANSFSYRSEILGSTSKSYTWESPDITKAGSNSIMVILTDDKNVSVSKTISVQTYNETSLISLDGSYIDKTLCVDLINNEIYKGYTRIGVRLKINHIYTLSQIKVTINGREQAIKSFDGNASTFTFIDNTKIETSGKVNVVLYAKDVNGNSSSLTLTQNVFASTSAPAKPTISFETSENRILLSEGEKITFQGTSTDLKDYQIIYALSACDVPEATSFCDNVNGSYISANSSSLSTNLTNKATGALRYYILKDFGISGRTTCVTQDSSIKNKFHIHPLSPNHSDKFYALQFFDKAKPGDMIYIYIKERKTGSFNDYIYSTSLGYNEIPKKDMFAMCVIPPAAPAINIYKVEQTDSRLTVRYSNPLYDVAATKNPIHLIDICLIAKDGAGNLFNNSGVKSKSETRKRDGLNGKTWLYYSDRKWHNIVPYKTSTYNNKKTFETSFDISKYPKGTHISVVAFYYTDYYNHPSIYSTSNILNVNKSNVKMSLKISSPVSGSVSATANPTFKIRVSGTGSLSTGQDSIYENYNFATGYDEDKWISNPVWFRVPKSKDTQMPNFIKADCNTSNHPFKTVESTPTHNVEYYYSLKSIYTSAGLYRISGLSINDDGSYKENALFLKANDNNQVYIGDIETYTLLEKGYIDYTWTQKTGRFLSAGENTIEAFTAPYIYAKDAIDYEELTGYWLTDTTFYSLSIMPYNMFRTSILKPSSVPWSEVEADVLRIKMPYRLFKPNTSYTLKFSRYVDEGFLYDGTYTISNESDKASICSSYVYLNLAGSNLSGVKYTANNVIYSPGYMFVGSNVTTVAEVNNYEKWINDSVVFTTPDESTLVSLDRENKAIELTIKARGINILKIKNLTLASTDGTHSIDTNRGEVDSSIKENKVAIKVSYAGIINTDFGYIDPLKFKDIMDLREFLESIAKVYNVSVAAKWRTLVKDQTYLMARDFNDVRSYCIELFSAIEKKYINTFKGNVQAFKDLPIINSKELRGLTTFSSRGKHYFPEWDDLIDALKLQQLSASPQTIIGTVVSKESATWNTGATKWERYNQPIYLRDNEHNISGGLITPSTPVTTGTISNTDCTQVNINVTNSSSSWNYSKVVTVKDTSSPQLYLYDDGDLVGTLNYNQQTIFYFFDQSKLNTVKNSGSKNVQIIFTVANSSKDKLTRDDFQLIGDDFVNADDLKKRKDTVDEAGDIIMKCTSKESTEIIFVCTAAELAKYTCLRLRILRSFEYINMTINCKIKY